MNMEIILKSVESNVMVIGALVGMFVLAWLANFCFSLFYNLTEVQENFDKTKCVQGIVKAIAIGLGLVLVTIVISALPQLLVGIGIDIPESVSEFCSMSVILIPFASAIIYYVKDAVSTFINILGINKSELLDEEDVDEVDLNNEEIGVSLDTAEKNIESMDLEEPKIAEGEIGVSE